MINVLVVDDSTFMRLILKEILLDYGCAIAGEAANGEEALGVFKKTSPDLILMDITMPVMDGITALKKIRDIDPSAKIIMISAMGQQTYIREAIKSGAGDFIVKPFQKSKVIDCVRNIMGEI